MCMVMDGRWEARSKQTTQMVSGVPEGTFKKYTSYFLIDWLPKME